MNITDVLEFVPNDELIIELDDKYNFPDYELEISWREWRWNGARTQRLDETLLDGININPVDYLDENGNLKEQEFTDACISGIMFAINEENRAGPITLIA